MRASENIVGLELAACDHAPAEALEQRRCAGELRAQLGRHRIAMGVVGRVQAHAVGGLLGTEAGGHGTRLAGPDGGEQRIDRAEQRVDGAPAPIGDRARQGKERPVEQPGHVCDQQRRRHAR
jgi:hypothetical protein